MRIVKKVAEVNLMKRFFILLQGQKSNNYMEYQDFEPTMEQVSEPATVNYTINSCSNVESAITADELLNRLRPRIESLFE